MADISKITSLDGVTYDIKDATARSAIASLNNWDYVFSSSAATTPSGVTWTNSSGTSITGTLAASSSTMYKIYLVPNGDGYSASSTTGDYSDEYITLYDGVSVFYWEKIGSTAVDLSDYAKTEDLGDLAYKDSASGSYTPAGTLSGGAITVTANTATKYVATSATGGGSVTAGSAASCTLPIFTASVSNETLTLGWTAGSFSTNTPTKVTLPSFSSQTIATGIKSATISTEPTFTGTSGTVTVS